MKMSNGSNEFDEIEASDDDMIEDEISADYLDEEPDAERYIWEDEPIDDDFLADE